MRQRLVSLPMYPSVPHAVAGFAEGLIGHLREAGFGDVVFQREAPADMVAHWTAPGLALSQTCGYPLTHALEGRVRLVGTPIYDAPGCEGPNYSSVFVVRKGDAAATLADLRGRRAAYNEVTSQSGYNCLRAAVAPLSRDGRFFGEVMATGAHRRSMLAVLEGRADLAAIDCVTFALAGDEDPDATAGLRVLARSASAAGLPFITSAMTSDAGLDTLRAALLAACRDPALANHRRAMRLSGLAILPESAYRPILDMEMEAKALGYGELG